MARPSIAEPRSWRLAHRLRRLLEGRERGRVGRREEDMREKIFLPGDLDERLAHMKTVVRLLADPVGGHAQELALHAVAFPGPLRVTADVHVELAAGRAERGDRD